MARPLKTAPGLGERLASARGDSTRAEFAARLGVHENTIANYERGDRKADPEFLELLRTHARVDLNWLLTGEKSPPVSAALPAEVLESLWRIPRFDIQASAGAGALVASESPNGWMAVDRDWLSRYVSRSANVGVIEAAGDSMAPTIRNRDLLLVEVRDGFTVHDLLRGGIYVLTLDGGLVVKRLGIDKDVLVVTSDNPAHAEVRVSFAELEDRVKIHGIVFWSGGALETHR